MKTHIMKMKTACSNNGKGAGRRKPQAGDPAFLGLRRGNEWRQLAICMLAFNLAFWGIEVECHLPLATASPSEYVLKPGERWQTKENEAEGEVVMVNPGRIVLEYGHDETSVREIHLNLGDEKKIEFTRFKGLKDISVGDLVRVRYSDRFVENEEGKHSQYERTVTRIALVKSAARADALRS